MTLGVWNLYIYIFLYFVHNLQLTVLWYNFLVKISACGLGKTGQPREKPSTILPRLQSRYAQIPYKFLYFIIFEVSNNELA